MDDGSTVLFENADDGFIQQRGGRDRTESVDPKLTHLDNLASSTALLCESLRQRLAPDEISLELGVKLSGEAGWFIAKSSLEGSVKITVTWKQTVSDDKS
jgi:hypothetical protein